MVSPSCSTTRLHACSYMQRYHERKTRSCVPARARPMARRYRWGSGVYPISITVVSIAGGMTNVLDAFTSSNNRGCIHEARSANKNPGCIITDSTYGEDAEGTSFYTSATVQFTLKSQSAYYQYLHFLECHSQSTVVISADETRVGAGYSGRSSAGSRAVHQIPRRCQWRTWH
ncbi:hypothetical protein BGX38DRAFT_38128 [Terfezia claveryi]|nr:hypothetical protein BGX38DRAFT_38128 [Terfezia claveryi]